MLPLSNLVITLGKSWDYLRLIGLLHLFAIVMVWRSSFSISIMICLLLLIVVSLIRIIRSKTPVPQYTQLSHHNTYWLLHDIHRQQQKYEQVHISFDGGLFILLTLTDENVTKKLVIFNDQLSAFQYRALHVIGKTGLKKKLVKKTSI